MLKDIRPSEIMVHEEYAISFERGDGSGYSFPCDKDGNMTPRKDVHPTRFEFVKYVWRNLNDAISEYCKGNMTISLADYSLSYKEPAVGTCDCGRNVYLENDYGHGIDCECGRIYNLFGQELAPRSQWDDPWDDDGIPYNVKFGYVSGNW